MYAARLVESGTAERVFTRPLHPYARGLLGAVRGSIAGVPPSSPPSTAPRRTCSTPPRLPLPPALPIAIEKCLIDPPLELGEPGHMAACHRVSEIEALDPPLARAAVTSKPGVNGHDASAILDIRGAKKYFPCGSGSCASPSWCAPSMT